MFELFLQVVEEVGPQKVVQILTYNASVCKATKKIVEGKYPHILAFMCSSDSKFGIEH